MCRSTCFGRLHAHHQELTTALTASGITLERGGSSVVGRGCETVASRLVNLFELYDDARTCQSHGFVSSCLSLRPSVRLPAWNNLAFTVRIFMKFNICIFFQTPSRKFKSRLNRTRIAGTLHEDQYTFLVISRPVLLNNLNAELIPTAIC
jgi:hypothetical protein